MQPAAAQTQQLSIWKNPAVNSTGTEPTRSAQFDKTDCRFPAILRMQSLNDFQSQHIGSAPL